MGKIEKLPRKRREFHGMTGQTIYVRWYTMKHRCYNPNNPGYERYGGRGITVYQDWLDSFADYYDYVMSLPDAGKEEYTIDRINNDGNYEPGNVRWASNGTQARNKRNELSNYYGVNRVRGNKYNAIVTMYDKRVLLGLFRSPMKAAKVRDRFILSNDLLHETLNFHYPLRLFWHVLNRAIKDYYRIIKKR